MGFIAIVVVVALAASGGSGSKPKPVGENSPAVTNRAAHTSTTPEAAPHYNTGPSTGTGAKECGGEISGTPNASCPFAQNVHRAFFAIYNSIHVEPRHMTAFSPVTHKTYRLDCVIINTGDAECSTKTGAVVSFPVERPHTAPSSSELEVPQSNEAPSEPTPAEGSPSEGSPGEPPSSEPGSSEAGEDEVGSASHEGDTSFCAEHECIGKFTTEPGTVVECADGSYSHAGGISGACSDHGGVGKE